MKWKIFIGLLCFMLMIDIFVSEERNESVNLIKNPGLEFQKNDGI